MPFVATNWHVGAGGAARVHRPRTDTLGNLRSWARLKLRGKIANAIIHLGVGWMPHTRIATLLDAGVEHEMLMTLPEQRIEWSELGPTLSENAYVEHINDGDRASRFLIPSRSAYLVPRAHVRLPEGIVVTHGKLLTESLPHYTCAPMFGFVANWFRRGKTRHERRAFLLAMPWMKNYHLWIHYALPRLMVWEKLPERETYKVLIPEDAPKFVCLTLDRYQSKMPDFRYELVARTELHVDELVMTQPMSARDLPNPAAVSWLRETFLPEDPPQPAEFVYVTRAGALERCVVNEQELLIELEGLGFKVCDPSKCSFEEQIEVFSRARIVVGPHGAAFANLAFAPAGCHLVELIGGSHFYPPFRFLTAQVGASYSAIACESEGAHIAVSPDNVQTIVHEIQRVLAL